VAAGGKVLLITGASSGIGAETARSAAAAGWRVALGARSEDKLEALVAEIGAERALAFRCDVTEWVDQQALVAATLERFGALDAVFANAGFGASRGFLEESPEHWRSMVLTNILGVALTVRAALPHFRERGAGHFVITSSVVGRRSAPGSLYSASKFAVTGIGESLRLELADTPMRVTLIEPGAVDTPFFDNGMPGALVAGDVARCVMFALEQPPHMDVNEILLRPVKQPL